MHTGLISEWISATLSLFVRKEPFPLEVALFCIVVLAELVLHLIANQRSSFIRCIGSSPIYYAYAVCLGGEEAVLKTVGYKRLARLNRVYGVLFKGVKNLRFHWKFNIGNYEKSFRMKWLLFML